MDQIDHFTGKMRIVVLSSVKSASDISFFKAYTLTMLQRSVRPDHNSYLAIFLDAANWGRYDIITFSFNLMSIQHQPLL